MTPWGLWNLSQECCTFPPPGTWIYLCSGSLGTMMVCLWIWLWTNLSWSRTCTYSDGRVCTLPRAGSVWGRAEGQADSSPHMASEPQSLQVHSAPSPAHPHGLQTAHQTLSPQLCHIPAILPFTGDLPTCPTWQTPAYRPHPRLRRRHQRNLSQLQWAFLRGCQPLAESLSPCGDCYLILASSAAYDFHAEKSINSNSKT